MISIARGWEAKCIFGKKVTECFTKGYDRHKRKGVGIRMKRSGVEYRRRRRVRREIFCWSVRMGVILLTGVLSYGVTWWIGRSLKGGGVDVAKRDNQAKQEKVMDKEERYQKMDDPILVLVNRDNMLAKNYEKNLVPICEGRLQANGALYEDLTKLLKAGKEEGYSFWIASAYRSRERQQELVDEDVNTFMREGMSYEEALNKTYEETMPAGCSEHETGLALDILSGTNTKMNQSQEREPGNQWLREHCYEYGFVLRYPKEKENITHINYEPWHFRYVGKEVANYLYENGLVLEELEKDLKESYTIPVKN